MTTPLRIAHIADLHFWRVPLNPVLYLNKRLLGVGNLIVGRRASRFRQELATVLAQRLAALQVDMALFSGDFSSTSLESEFAAARAVFEPVVKALAQGARSVAGNHDTYTGSERDRATFRRALGSSFQPTQQFEAEILPNGIHLLKVDATTFNGMGSHGQVPDSVANRAEQWFTQMIGDSAPKQIFVLCHFPPEIAPVERYKHRGLQLLGCGPFMELLARMQVPVLWLHGHHHHRWIERSARYPNVVYLNGGAPLMRRTTTPPDLGFYQLNGDAENLEIICHSYPNAAWRSKAVSIPTKPGEWIDLQQQ